MKEEFKMEKSKVYFTSMKVNAGTNLLKKLNHLIKEAGIANIDFENKYTAIKIHFGEPGNLAYLRPNYAKVVVDLVKELGGRPFLTDCNTLYVGRRKMHSIIWIPLMKMDTILLQLDAMLSLQMV